MADERFSFEELLARYNYPLRADNKRLFTRLIHDECARREHPVRVLDIGCGQGFSRQPGFQRVIRGFADEYVGIEPDASVEPAAGVFDSVEHAVLEASALPDASIDVAYSFWVMEHVEDPTRFFRAIERVLKPGGTYLFVTLNLHHWFARLSQLADLTGMEDFLLRTFGGTPVESHYETFYRANSRRSIETAAREAGLSTPDIAYLEVFNAAQGYMGGPLRPFWYLFQIPRRIFHRPESLGTLFVRVRKD